MKKLILFLKKKDLYLGIIRYILGLVMICYGFTKILKTQFVLLPFSAWQLPLENLPGRNLAWAFLGYSDWFQMFLGFLECAPAILLLYRRTTFFGAILLLPMTLNVLLINYALDLWQETQWISLFLLILNILVLVFEWKKIRNILQIIFNKGFSLRFKLHEAIINIIVIVVLLYICSLPLLKYRAEKNFLTGDWFNKRPNEWILQYESINDSILPFRKLRCYFMPGEFYSELTDTSNLDMQNTGYVLNDSDKIITLYDNESEEVTKKYSYNIVGDTLLQLKTNDSSNNYLQCFKKRVMNINH